VAHSKPTAFFKNLSVITDMLDFRIGMVCGLFGGLGKYFIQVQTTPFYINAMGAALTALLCGAAGVAGKEMYLFVKKKIKNYRSGTKKKIEGKDTEVV
jgi:hypothetical protein